MSRRLDLPYLTLIAELVERALDGQFDADFDLSGLFKKRMVKDREYWYFRPSSRGNPNIREKYAGPADDPAIASRVENFASLKADYKYRQRLVSTLVREARLFKPERHVAGLLHALAKSGVFRLRACLVGTIAYQTYSTVLGYRLPDTALQTGDIDVAQFHSVSVAVDDTIPPILEILQGVDSSFRRIPSLNDSLGTTRFSATGGLRLEFLTPNRGSDDHAGRPVAMPALGGAAAEPLRFLDYLIHDPVRTVILDHGGIPVRVPEPARFAVHKLIVAERRTAGAAKDLKDLAQSRNIAEAFQELGRLSELREAFGEAQRRGQQWRTALERSLERLQQLGMPNANQLFAEKS